ncbi:MAG TPA: T9SS type A sorting domain-containing protein [Saprospiraceae bacterium]|nr:T9SS type A sorting domain-containing protein [Saprospiraceae bacterium]
MFRMLSLTGLFCLAVAFAQAQTFPYQFSYTNEPYTGLTNATVLNNIAVWNDEATAPIGFTFLFDNLPQTEMFVLGYSGAILPVGQYENGDTLDAIFGYAVLPGLSPLSNTIVQYKTEGSAPNRIFKLEMAKAGFDGVQGEVSFQIWLYETSNAIQIRLGNQFVPNPANTYFNTKSPLIGYMLNYHYFDDDEAIFPQAQFVTGTPQVPQDSVITGDIYNEALFDGPQYGMSGIPLNNSVFTFTPGTVSTNQPGLTLMQLFPNPVVDYVQLAGLDRSGAAQVQLMDAQGKLLRQLELSAGEDHLQLPEDLAPGAYTLRYTAQGQLAVARFIKG